MFIQLLILILGFILLISGANLLINGSSGIAKKFNIPEILIGLTIVALGTSLPELVVTITSSISNNTDILLGNVIGSNIYNLILVLPIVAVIKPVKFKKSTIKINLPFLNIITILVLLMGLGIFSEKKLIFTQKHGIILLIIALIYFVSPIIQYIKDKQYLKTIENKKINIDNKKNIIQYIIYILLGGFVLKYGGDFVVSSSTLIADMINIPERVVSITIVALGTSLPELITSIVAIIKHDDDIAEGNIIGSCIINFSLILGVGATFSNLSITISYIEDLILLLASSILIFLYALGNKNNILTRNNGIVLLIIYLIYLVRLFI